MSHEFWLILIAILVAIVCSLNGCFLVVRRQAMLGDAISHSILLGIVVAYLLSGERSIILMFLGSVVAGLASAFAAQALQRFLNLKIQDSIGLVFTSFFALSVILIAAYADNVDLDQTCVLFGEIAFAPIDIFQISGQSFGPRSFLMLSFALVVTLVVYALSWHRLKNLSFDPLHAKASGIKVFHWQTLLTALLSISAVSAFDAVGAIMVVAMLTITPNTARRFSNSLFGMLIASTILATFGAIVGYYVSAQMDSSIAASIAVVTGLVFIGSLFLPKRQSA